MNEEGEVVEVIGGNVRVRIDRKSACGGNCANCGVCGQQANVVLAKNQANAELGDTVLVQMPSGNVLKAAFLVYIIPLLMFFLGYYLASLFTKSDGICAFSAFVFMIICFFLVHAYDSRIREKYRHIAVLVTEKHTKK